MMNTLDSAVAKAKQSYLDDIAEEQASARKEACIRFFQKVGDSLSKEIYVHAHMESDGYAFIIKLPHHLKIRVRWKDHNDHDRDICYSVECCPKEFTDFSEALLMADPNLNNRSIMQRWLGRFWRNG